VKEVFAALLCKSRARSPEDRLSRSPPNFWLKSCPLTIWPSAASGCRFCFAQNERIARRRNQTNRLRPFTTRPARFLSPSHLALSNVERRSSPQLHDDFQNVSLLYAKSNRSSASIRMSCVPPFWMTSGSYPPCGFSLGQFPNVPACLFASPLNSKAAWLLPPKLLSIASFRKP